MLILKTHGKQVRQRSGSERRRSDQPSSSKTNELALQPFDRKSDDDNPRKGHICGDTGHTKNICPSTVSLGRNHKTKWTDLRGQRRAQRRWLMVWTVRCLHPSSSPATPRHADIPLAEIGRKLGEFCFILRHIRQRNTPVGIGLRLADPLDVSLQRIRYERMFDFFLARFSTPSTSRIDHAPVLSVSFIRVSSIPCSCSSSLSSRIFVE